MHKRADRAAESVRGQVLMGSAAVSRRQSPISSWHYLERRLMHYLLLLPGVVQGVAGSYSSWSPTGIATTPPSAALAASDICDGSASCG